MCMQSGLTLLCLVGLLSEYPLDLAGSSVTTPAGRSHPDYYQAKVHQLPEWRMITCFGQGISCGLGFHLICLRITDLQLTTKVAHLPSFILKPVFYLVSTGCDICNRFTQACAGCSKVVYPI